MDMRELEGWCEESGKKALEALLEASDEMARDRLEGEDLMDMKCAWSAIHKIKMCMEMDEGIRRRMR